MGYDARIDSLRMKHAELDEVLVAEARRPIPDPAMLADLKRQKLRIKDELERIAQPAH
ncbi:YdcH family protein [Insolitispirillum peregrinum]|uniref:YdcH family protein n=1 Tax=Insolitispirillum peregrinum TaxID=80876 RepID=UPI003606F961